VQGFNVQFKSRLNRLSLSHKSNKKDKKRKTKQKNRRAIKSGNGHENQWDPSKKVRETMEGMIYGKGKFWVWSGSESGGDDDDDELV